jgi:hypothetical protein
MCGDYCLVNKWNVLGHLCHSFAEKSLMTLRKLMCLTFWTYVHVTISYHWGKVTKSKQHFRVFIFMGMIMAILTIGFENGPLQNFKELWIRFWMVLPLPNVTSTILSFLAWLKKMTSIIYKKCLIILRK